MTRGGGPGLSEWIDEVGALLRAYFDEPSHWRQAQDRAAAGDECDYVAELGQRQSDAERVVLECADRMSRRYLGWPDRGTVVILAPDAKAQLRAVDLWVLAAAAEAQRVISDRWGECIPAGWPEVQAQRTQRAVERSLASRRPGETMTEILRRAGVSRAQGYRVLDKKPRR